jgi:type VI protein secretion system component VasK
VNPFEWIGDHPVEASAILWGILVLIGLAVLAFAGLGLWRTARAAQRRLEAELSVISAKSDQINAALAALPQRQEELQDTLESLRRRTAVAQAIGGFAGKAVGVLRSPLSYLGR